MSKYVVSEPSALKFLKANGAVVDENGNVVNDENDYWKKVYEQAEPKVCKYLHADGTIDENPGSSSGVDLEDNHQTTIDVSTYNAPVEVTPTQGKDGMKKVTVTLENIPSGGSAVLYAWAVNGNEGTAYFNTDIAPSDPADANNIKGIVSLTSGIFVTPLVAEGDTYAYISDTEFTLTSDGVRLVTYTRDSTKDLVLWG